MLFAEIPWNVLLSPFGIPIIAIICVFAWLIVASISEEVGKVLRHKATTDLKLELMARGLTSEEIVRIVEAGRTDVEEPQAQVHVHTVTGHA